MPSKPTKTVVADIARMVSGKQMAEARRMMRNVGQGRLGVFAVSRDAISSTAKEDVDARELLNSKYTLRKLIVCKEFAVMAVEKTENPNGTKMTKYICGRSQASTLVRNLGGSGLKFQSGKLNNGVWMR